MPAIDVSRTPKPVKKYLVIKMLGDNCELLCETDNFNSAASYHLQHASPSNGIYLLKNIEYAFTAKEVRN